MQGPDLIFHLTDENYNFYQPDRDGLLVISSNPYFFQFSPDGWYNIEIKNIRNRNYWAVDRSVSIPLTYLGDAGKLIKSIVMTRGTEQVKVYLTICSQQLHHTPGVEYSYYYKKEFRGNIDLSSYTHEGVKVTVTSQEDGLPKHLKAMEGSTLELPMNVPEAKMVKFDGVTLRNNFSVSTTNEQIDNLITPPQFTKRIYSPITLFQAGGDNNNSNIALFNVQSGEVSTIDYANSDLNFLEALGNVSLSEITINIPIRYIAGLPPGNAQYSSSVNIYIKNQDGSIIRNLYSNSTIGPVDLSLNITDTFSANLIKGDKWFLITELYITKGVDVFNYIVSIVVSEGLIEFKTSSRFLPTYVPHFTGQYIFDKLIEYVTGSEYSAALSSFLNLNRNILFTCGDAIRNLKDSSGNSAAVMKITLKKFFKFWDCLYAAGLIPLEATKKVDIDEKVNLAERTKVIRLPSPETPPKVFLRKDMMWNVLKIGYPEIKNEVGVLNGNEAFCCGFEWRTNATSSPAEINKISEIRTDCYEQEIIRITLTDKDTTDNKRDNEVYANYVDGSLVAAGTDYPAHYILSRALNATATGLLEKDTVWNLRLSPKRMLLNNGGFLRSSMLHCDGLDIIYSTADKNNRVSAGGITEKENIQLGSAGAKFFYPVGISMNLPAPANILDLLNTAPLSTVEVEIGGVVYTGILEKSGIFLAGNRVTEFEILLDERNDLSTLIDYDG